MGYTTDFEGGFDLNKPLTAEQTAYLRQFIQTRRMARDPDITDRLPDPIREAVGLPVGEQGEFYVGDAGGDYFIPVDRGGVGILDYNRPPSTQPGLWCQWEMDEGGQHLAWDGGEKFYNYIDWLEYMITAFFDRWGVTLEGDVYWKGEESDDRGLIQCRPSEDGKTTDVTIKLAKISYE